MENQGLDSLFQGQKNWRPDRLSVSLNGLISKKAFFWLRRRDRQQRRWAQRKISPGIDGGRCDWIGGKSSVRALPYNAPVDLAKI
jgi:hypothetical protein